MSRTDWLAWSRRGSRGRYSLSAFRCSIEMGAVRRSRRQGSCGTRGGKPARFARPGADLPGDLPRPRVLLRPYAAARRSARDRQPVARDYARSHGARNAVS
jgi:hypothetical protein